MLKEEKVSLVSADSEYCVIMGEKKGNESEQMTNPKQVRDFPISPHRLLGTDCLAGDEAFRDGCHYDQSCSSRDSSADLDQPSLFHALSGNVLIQ